MIPLATIFYCLWVVAVTLAFIYLLMQEERCCDAISELKKKNRENIQSTWMIMEKVTLVEQDAEEIGNRQEELKERLAKLEKELSWIRTKKPNGF